MVDQVELLPFCGAEFVKLHYDLMVLRYDLLLLRGRAWSKNPWLPHPNNTGEV